MQGSLGSYDTIYNIAAGLYLDVSGYSGNEGANIDLWCWNGQGNQSFVTVPFQGLSRGSIMVPVRARIPSMSTQNSSKDQLLAEGVAWREAGRLDEARGRMLDLSHAFPDDGPVAYQAAWIHDRLGLEREAVPYYLKALSSGQLSAEDRLGALTGCGSTLRILGRYEEAVELLEGALAEFPGDGGLAAFLAMALYNVGRHHDSTSMLLRLVATSSTAPNIKGYRAAIEYYAGDLDKIEGAS